MNRKGVVAGLVSILMLTSCGGDSSNNSTPDGDDGMIAVTCHFTQRAEIDPIRANEQGAVVHLHDFFGATSVDNNTTAQTLVTQSNSCLSNGDRSAYWVPTMFVDGVAREAIDLAVYLQAASDDAEVIAPPNGLEMISFRSAWKCVPDGFVSSHMSHCPPNAKTRLILEFPHCWDGKSLGYVVESPHVVSAHDQCPDSHPVALPRLLMEVRYDLGDVDDLRTISFSSGDLTSVHGDVLFAWNQEILQRDLRECVARGITCGITWSTDVGA